jgi:predicted RNase H-like nuclease (RuvC/YqgF family)
MINGTTICSKHEKIEQLAKDIESLVDDARVDGVKMEKRLEEQNEEIDKLLAQIKELESERDMLIAEIDSLSSSPSA